MRSPIPLELLERKAILVRGRKVVDDGDLATIYGVSLKTLRSALKRHKARFPRDFVVQLDDGAYALTEEGILMLSAVLKSRQAAQINIELIRSLCAARST